MRIRCPYCKHKAVVVKHTYPAPKCEEVYARCSNEECQASFVSRFYFSHTLQPPISELGNSLFEQIANSDDATKNAIKELLI